MVLLCIVTHIATLLSAYESTLLNKCQQMCLMNVINLSEVSTSVTFMELTLGDYTMLMNGNNSTLFSTALSSEPHEVPSII